MFGRRGSLRGGQSGQDSGSGALPEWRRSVPKRYYERDVTVTPRVHAKNYGELDVVEVESESPRPIPDE